MNPLFANKLNSNYSPAMEGNVLEALALVCNMCDKHYMNRPLNRTAMNICVVTAGTGFWSTDREMTKFVEARILANGIGCDIVSLTSQPLHPTPLFMFKDGQPLPKPRCMENWKNYEFEFPIHWMQIKYFSSKAKDIRLAPRRP
eukprot:UN02574